MKTLQGEQKSSFFEFFFYNTVKSGGRYFGLKWRNYNA